MGLMSVVDELARAGGTALYLQRNYDVLRRVVADSLRRRGLLLEPLREAVSRHSWVRKLLWRALPREEGVGLHGAFLYVPPGLRIQAPLTFCFVVSEAEQLVHNIVVVDEGSEVLMTSACASTERGEAHKGYTEVYLRRGARLNYVMIHSWMRETKVTAKTGVEVGEGGSFTQFYTCLKSPSSLTSDSRALLGQRATALLSTLYVASPGSSTTISSTLILAGEGSRGEVLARAVAVRGAALRLPPRIEARAPGSRGHIECRGLQLSPDSRIETAPILYSLHGGSQLTHEAAIGKISEEELYYLMSRGFTEEEATSLLVRGFLETGIRGLPKVMRPQVEAVLSILARKAVG
ncbi:MAG: hypothetical protein DRJ57_05370 [Thermoprotei archaeon]|nr:MAG: hypothetical protein DRJ57_05370 [Thermoprotei archaeon]